MTTTYTLTTLKRELIRSFATLDGWFDKEDEFFNFKPPDGKAAREVFDYILALSNTMMTIIDHGGDHARRQAFTREQNGIDTDYAFMDLAIDDQDWDGFLRLIERNRINFTACNSLPEIRSELRDQLDRCLCHLELLKNGEGVLFKTTFEAGANPAVNLYQCMKLLSRHLQHFAAVFSEIEEEFNATL